MSTSNIQILDTSGNVYHPETNSDIVKVNDTNLTEVLKNKSDITDIPIKLSQLTNDSGFITNDDISAIPTNNINELF